MKAVILSVFLVTLTNASLLSRSYQRISGGTSAPITTYPFAAALITNAGAGSYQQACGGSILTDSAILTAASCFHTEGVEHPIHWWRARVGSVYANSGGVTHLIRLISRHPSYNWREGDGDIAVLRLTFPLALGPSVSAVNIAGGAYPDLENQQPIDAIGWGLLSEGGDSSIALRSVQFWAVDRQLCRQRYAARGFTVTDNMVCAGWLDVGVKAQCEGDTGSPLLHHGVVVGVYSQTAGECAEGRYPGINTRVSAYTSWIIQEVRKQL
ncbi:unnamed protein product [Plutella xylostella]|uniref:(diamondback moth) hypothetical protein n=1 Tax=Plutella xylostella TaxID=51655 RepID=A0A8S4E9Y1_PLUXY|nr:unnamed protein product [Plutella xylostella]